MKSESSHGPQIAQFRRHGVVVTGKSQILLYNVVIPAGGARCFEMKLRLWSRFPVFAFLASHLLQTNGAMVPPTAASNATMANTFDEEGAN